MQPAAIISTRSFLSHEHLGEQYEKGLAPKECSRGHVRRTLKDMISTLQELVSFLQTCTHKEEDQLKGFCVLGWELLSTKVISPEIHIKAALSVGPEPVEF